MGFVDRSVRPRHRPSSPSRPPRGPGRTLPVFAALSLAFAACAPAPRAAPPPSASSAPSPGLPLAPSHATSSVASAPLRLADFEIPILSGDAYVQRVVRTYGYTLAPAKSDGTMVIPDLDPKLPRLLAWVRAEQARGRVVLARASLFEPHQCPEDDPCGEVPPMFSVDRDADVLTGDSGFFRALPNF